MMVRPSNAPAGHPEPGELYELELLGPDEDTRLPGSPRRLGNVWTGAAGRSWFHLPSTVGDHLVGITVRVVGRDVMARAVLFDRASGKNEPISVAVRSVGTGELEELSLRPLPVAACADKPVQVLIVTAAASDAILGVTATLRARQDGELAS